MGILQLSADNTIPTEITCVLCGKRIPPGYATFGPIDAEGNITILCAGHQWDGLRFIDALADYMAEERRKYLRENGNNIMRFGGLGADAWSIY